MRKLRTYDCEDCGQETTRKRHSIDPRICFECGLKRAAAAAVSMAEKSGDAYDRAMANPATGRNKRWQKPRE